MRSTNLRGLNDSESECLICLTYCDPNVSNRVTESRENGSRTEQEQDESEEAGDGVERRTIEDEKEVDSNSRSEKSSKC